MPLAALCGLDARDEVEQVRRTVGACQDSAENFRWEGRDVEARRIAIHGAADRSAREGRPAGYRVEPSAQVAQYLGLHESTVSRATADKYVMLPNRHVIPFSEFFQASLSAKDRIREMITTEPRPLTDKEIVQRLREQGVRIARRTVTKYRNQLGIMPSTFR